MSDRTQWAEAAINRAATLVPLAEAAEPYFASRQSVLIEKLVLATSDASRAEYAHELRALRSFKAWLLAQEATGDLAQKELEKLR